MEALPREELERLVFFESAREQAELEWKQNPKDAQVLLKWTGCRKGARRLDAAGARALTRK